MPFITRVQRALIDQGHVIDLEPGDRCYIFYKQMVELWKAKPRWTTAHQIYKDMYDYDPTHLDDRIAYELAWQVFFNLHVMPYELKKREENGDI